LTRFEAALNGDEEMRLQFAGTAFEAGGAVAASFYALAENLAAAMALGRKS
jgi:hypothetical protein